MKTSLAWLNVCSPDEFVAVCGRFFEHSPWIAERTLHSRPFATREMLLAALSNTVTAGTQGEQLSLICAHPDLVGRLAEQGALTAESTNEQRAAGLTDLSPAERQQFSDFNAGYWQKFGFPFVICARENKKEAILAAFPLRLANDVDLERQTALAEIAKIARLRLWDAIEEEDTMNGMLVKQTYGKSNVRLTRVTRHADRHELRELSLDISLEGEFTGSYLTGDNSQIVATDTMKNTVYALAADDPVASPESFALALTDHFIRRNAHVTSATVCAIETPWQRISTGTGPHRHSFMGNESQRRTCQVERSREGCVVTGGVTGLGLLKTTDSAFKGFLRDEFTTLPDTDDRIFATFLEATWTFSTSAATPEEWNDWFDLIRGALIAVFADHYSLSVQQTMYVMGQEALRVCPSLAAIDLAMPNQHRIPVNLTPFGKENRGEVFVTTSEPFGYIWASLVRKDA